MSTSIGSTQSGAWLWSLSRNFDESFDLLLDVLMHPRFDAERLETLKGQYVERMRRRRESPGRAVRVLLDRVIYGEHPRLGYVATRAQVEAVTPDDVRAVWRRHLGGDNLFVTAVGDFDAAAIVRRIETAFGSWRQAEQTERLWITHEPLLAPGAYLVEQALPQPAVQIYHQIAVDRTAPLADHAALEILNDILGGSGFRSRLMERLRSDEGLTYGISSSLAHQGRPGVPGRIVASYQTKQDSVVQSIDSVLEEFRRILAEDVGPQEVQEQIEAWRNRFIFAYTNDFYTVSRLMGNELDDRPYDFEKRMLDAVQQVRVEDVRRVAGKFLRPEQLTVAIFGTPTDADRAALTERFRLQVLDAAQVFSGGYETLPHEAGAGR
jgi:zinc protease